MDEPMMKIGEIAAFFDVSVKAIRVYEKRGILTPAYTDPETGYRYYSADQVQTLNALLELKSLGFSLAEIKRILSGGASAQVFADALDNKRQHWQDAIAVAENKIDAIQTIQKRLAGSHEAVKLQELSEEQRAWLLVKMVCVENLQGQSQLSEAIWV